MRHLLVLAAAAAAALPLLSTVADAQSRRGQPQTITVTPRSYLDPGREVRARTSADYAVSPLYTLASPTANMDGSTRSPLPDVFNGGRPFTVDWNGVVMGPLR